MRVSIKVAFTFLLLFLCTTTYAEDEKDMIYKYWVELKDKAVDAYSVDKPQVFLSQKAIDRRAKQGIKITEQDYPVNEAYINRIQEDVNGRVLSRSRWFNALIVEVYSEETAKTLEAMDIVKKVTLLGEWEEKEKEEEEVEEDSAYQADLDKEVENFTRPGRNSYLFVKGANARKEGKYGDAFDQIKVLNGVRMHEMGFDGEGMTIAVLDAGFWKVNSMPQFDSLRKNNQILGTKDFVAFDGDVYKDDSHGMNVLSCMGGNIEGVLVGTAPKASYWLIRTEDDGSEFPVEEANWAIGAEFADSIGADVINSSLGYTSFDGDKFPRVHKDLDGKTSIATLAADIAASKGIVVCNSAGNSGTSKTFKYIGAPADANNILTVGGITRSKLKSNFSSYGPTGDGRIKPTICSVGTNSAVAEDKGSGTANGTSFSSPILCGMVACLWQANPTKTYKEIMDAIIQSGSHYNKPNNELGNGVPDFYYAHLLLNDPQAEYTKDQIVAPYVSTFANWLDIRFYSTTTQKVTVLIQYEKEKGAKRKKVYSSSHEVGAKQFLLVNPEKKLKSFYKDKYADGSYFLTITAADGTKYTRKLSK